MFLKLRNTFIRKTDNLGLINRDFSIVSNNCWGGAVYQYFDLPYKTPFVGLFIREDDYVRMLNRFEYYMFQELVFEPICETKYPDLTGESYPLGLLGDIEIHFMHYSNSQEAKEKWDRRKQQINHINLLFKLSERTPYCTLEVQRRFLSLPFENIILFTQQQQLTQANPKAIYVPELAHISSGTENSVVNKHIKIHKFLNSLKEDKTQKSISGKRKF